ncbi:MAG TPA: NAD-dependent succinate-semialdehyde dehydrogenase [Caldithrix abyssi]|uniref:NAD-dependent succinate-semialdehyde dehydrogenase n=1 Tax=Caldithrix abyssi TaxID=187145 RepID=A0A7V5UEF9_CALAY|nr:NAD-dependent succinate-semialdehyde dehydrogenase [Caldithrix abyssi]
MKAINPATGQLIREYDEHSLTEVEQIIDQVDETFRAWRQTDFTRRRRLMHRAADVLRRDKEKLARLITVEMGKVIKEARAEVEKCAWVCDYYADHAERFLADEVIESDASKSFVAFEPLGVILAVMPWNFPFWQVFRFAAPALMAGNAAVLKHASNVPGCALAIEEVFQKAGFPEHLFRTLMIGSDKVEQVIRNPKVKAATLTGSEPAGSKVAAIAGSEIKKTVLELGGSDPFIVLEDADIPACVVTASQARMINAGQSCIAAKRFIVVESRVAEFEQQQTAIMKAMKIGDPLLEETQAGPLAREDLLEELHAQVTQSIEKGARLLTGGRKADGPGYFYLPTVLADVKKGMAVYDQETFGPVSAIIPVKDEKEAIRVANDSEFGLGGSVWSRNIERAVAVARQIESGAVFVNGMTKSDPRLPFGGVKKSGYGRELSHYGIKEFVNIKTIWIA